MQYTLTRREDGVVSLKFTKIKLDGIDLQDPLAIFPLQDYDALYEDYSGTLQPSAALNSINAFLKTLEDNDYEPLLLTILAANSKILTLFTGPDAAGIVGAHAVTEEICDMLIRLAEEINLKVKAYDFVDKFIKVEIKDLPAEDKLHYTSERTYNVRELTGLYAMSLACKLFAPLFGSLAHHLNSSSAEVEDDIESDARLRKIDVKLREQHAYAMCSRMIESIFPAERLKLARYVRAYLSKAMKSVRDGKMSMTYVFHGNIEANLELRLMALFLSKRFVTNDPDGPYDLISQVSSAIQYELRNANNASAQHYVDERKEHVVSSDDRQKSQLELGSRVTLKTADVPLITQAFVNVTADRLVVQAGLSKTDHKRITRQLIKLKTHGTPLNQFLVNQTFGPEFSGSSTLNTLTIQQRAPLLAYVVLHVTKLGYDKLAHGLCAMPTNREHLEVTREEQTLRLGFDKKHYYNKYLELMTSETLGFKNVRFLFKELVERIIYSMTGKVYLYTTPEVVWGDHKVLNGEPIKVDDQMFEEFFEYLYCHVGDPYES